MKTSILITALTAATLGLSACAKQDDAGNAATANTVTLNDESDAGLDTAGNVDAPALGNDGVPLDNDAGAAPLAAGNGL